MSAKYNIQSWTSQAEASYGRLTHDRSLSWITFTRPTRWAMWRSTHSVAFR